MQLDMKIALVAYITLILILSLSCSFLLQCTTSIQYTDVHLITFGSKEFTMSARVLEMNAALVSSFASVNVYGISDIDHDFILRNASLMANPRGHGYWIWKPYVILKRLLELPNDDVLCYMDSRYAMIGDLASRMRTTFADSEKWIHVLKDHHFVPGSRFRESEWSKCDASVLMDVPIKGSDLQAWAGFIAIRKCPEAVMFVSEWLAYCQDPRIVSDDPDVTCECRGRGDQGKLVENRHDQTVLSLLLRKWGLPLEESDLSSIVHRT